MIERSKFYLQLVLEVSMSLSIQTKLYLTIQNVSIRLRLLVITQSYQRFQRKCSSRVVTLRHHDLARHQFRLIPRVQRIVRVRKLLGSHVKQILTRTYSTPNRILMTPRNLVVHAATSNRASVRHRRRPEVELINRSRTITEKLTFRSIVDHLRKIKVVPIVLTV